MNVGSLFSGIGGLDLGLERAGMTVRWQSEIDPYASKVLAKHWPNVPNHGDITTIDWSQVEPVDLICGGYPCQPFSLAGDRRGHDHPSHLWPYFHRAIRDLRPRVALLENVPGHLSMGFDRVLGDLAEIGYDVEWCSVPAAAVGAPHLRWRIFAVAYPNGGRFEPRDPREWRVPVTHACSDVPDAERDELRIEPVGLGRSRCSSLAGDDGSSWDVADSESERRPGRILARPHMVDDGSQPSHGDAGARRDDEWWAVEPDVGRVAHGIPSRVDRLRCLGNAVVPQVAEWIGRRIMEAVA